VPFVAYVHAQQPDPAPPERPAWEPNWRLWRWIAAVLALAVGAGETEGVTALVLVLGAFALGCKAVDEALPDGDGLREHRQ
jgi:hypothetical protein